MKVGFRTPNIKKSVKARTTGKVKRTVKKSVNPLYGKKGMGYVNDPKKTLYNKIYNKTTTDARPESLVNIGKGKKESANKDCELTQSYYKTEDRANTASNQEAHSSTKGVIYLMLSIISLIAAICLIIYHVNNMRNYEMAKTAIFPYLIIITFLVISASFFWIYLKKNK